MARRLTMHAGKIHASRHNDRDFDLSKSDHIDGERQNENYYLMASKSATERGLSFEDFEHEFYEKHFGKTLTEINEKYIKSGHRDRCKTIDDYLKDSRTCPRETIFQIGTRDDHVNRSELTKVFDEFQKWHRRTYPQIHTLDIAFHGDESTPHIHWRTVGIAHDKNGREYPSIKKSLAEMNVDRPNLEKPDNRFNNATITYTETCRNKMYEICREHNIELIEEPRENSRGRKSLNAEIYKLNSEIKDLKKTIKNQSLESQRKLDELTAHKRELEKTLAEKENVAVTVSNAKKHLSEIKSDEYKLSKHLDDINLNITAANANLETINGRVEAAAKLANDAIDFVNNFADIIAAFLVASKRGKKLSANERELIYNSKKLKDLYTQLDECRTHSEKKAINNEIKVLQKRQSEIVKKDDQLKNLIADAQRRAKEMAKNKPKTQTQNRNMNDHERTR